MGRSDCPLPPGEAEGDLSAGGSSFSFEGRLLLLCIFPGDRAVGSVWKEHFMCCEAGTLKSFGHGHAV